MLTSYNCGSGESQIKHFRMVVSTLLKIIASPVPQPLLKHLELQCQDSLRDVVDNEADFHHIDPPILKIVRGPVFTVGPDICEGPWESVWAILKIAVSFRNQSQRTLFAFGRLHCLNDS